jgi:hypothetical protein
MEFFPIILPVVLYGCETWSLTLREANRLRVFEKRVLTIILAGGENCATGSFITCILSQVKLKRWSQRELDWQGM